MADYYMSDDLLRELAQQPLSADGPARHFDTYRDDDMVISRRRGAVASAAIRDALSRNSPPECWRHDSAMPPVSWLLAVYLDVLNTQQEIAYTVYGPDALDTAQRHLSRILCAYPVLLHPYLRTYVEPGIGAEDRGTCSLAHAIALTRHGRFPMKRDGFTTQELVAFANDPCVLLGLSLRQPNHEGMLTQVKRSTALGAGLRHFAARPGLIASLHGLHDAMDPQHRKIHGANLLLRSVADRSGVNLQLVYRSSFTVALGLYRNSSGPGACTVATPEFMPILAKAEPAMREEVRERLTGTVHTIIFPDGASTAPARVEEAVRVVTAGLVQAGMAGDVVEAAVWLHGSMVETLPIVGVEQALACVRTLADLGAEVMGPFACIGGPSAVREVWSEATHLYAIETGMQQAIRAAAAGSDKAGAVAQPSAINSRVRRCL